MFQSSIILFTPETHELWSAQSQVGCDLATLPDSEPWGYFGVVDVVDRETRFKPLAQARRINAGRWWLVAVEKVKVKVESFAGFPVEGASAHTQFRIGWLISSSFDPFIESADASENTEGESGDRK